MSTHSRRGSTRQSSPLFASQPHLFFYSLAFVFLGLCAVLTLWLSAPLPLSLCPCPGPAPDSDSVPLLFCPGLCLCPYLCSTPFSLWLCLFICLCLSLCCFPSVSSLYLIFGTECLSSSQTSFELMLILFVCVFVVFRLLCAYMCRYNFCFLRLMDHCRSRGRIITRSREMKALVYDSVF